MLDCGPQKCEKVLSFFRILLNNGSDLHERCTHFDYWRHGAGFVFELFSSYVRSEMTTNSLDAILQKSRIHQNTKKTDVFDDTFHETL